MADLNTIHTQTELELPYLLDVASCVLNSSERGWTETIMLHPSSNRNGTWLRAALSANS